MFFREVTLSEIGERDVICYNDSYLTVKDIYYKINEDVEFTFFEKDSKGNNIKAIFKNCTVKKVLC